MERVGRFFPLILITMKSKNNLNLLPALAILATVAILVAIGGTDRKSVV